VLCSVQGVAEETDWWWCRKDRKLVDAWQLLDELCQQKISSAGLDTRHILNKLHLVISSQGTITSFHMILSNRSYRLCGLGFFVVACCAVLMS